MKAVKELVVQRDREASESAITAPSGARWLQAVNPPSSSLSEHPLCMKHLSSSYLISRTTHVADTIVLSVLMLLRTKYGIGNLLIQIAQMWQAEFESLAHLPGSNQ